MSDIEWKLDPIAIKLLKDNPKNPRQINKDVVQRLGEFIDKFGLIDKPIINQDNTIIGGHQRIRLLKKKKAKTVECWVPSRMLTEEECDELMIGVNKIHGQFDYDLLSTHFEPLDLLKWGFTEKELFDSCAESEKIMEEMQQEEKKKALKTCPNCGCEF